jgi:opacity protein-like surface antigen
VARVHLGKHLRVGTEGYVSTLNYGGKGNDSHARIGWGGLLADCMWQLGRWAPYVGGTIGGGGMKNLTLRNPTPLDNEVESDASFRRYSFMLVAPFAGVEFALTDKIRLNLKVDWLVNLTNRQPDFPTGPRVYLGFSFYRLKETASN